MNYSLLKKMKTYNREEIHLDRPAHSVKHLHRCLWALGYYVNVFKWLGKYNIVIGNKDYTTEALTLRDYTIEDWVEFINKKTK